MSSIRVDVAIIGGGLAGSCLARQLKRARPELDVAVIERDAEPGYKVGESTVEIAANYLVRRLGLGRYLYDEQLPKNGLRFFFDSPGRDAELPALGEIGSDALPFHPSFQIDRRAFERSLWAMNQADGVRSYRATRVAEVRPNASGGDHELHLADESRQRTMLARWVVDASGRARVLQRAVGTRRAATDHPIAAVWGRYTDVADIDQLGPEPWRDRVRHTSRNLSTNHFCYRGYWIWFIPLRGGVTSIGWVGDRARFDPRWGESAGFMAFLGEHRAVATLVERATNLDLGSYRQLAYDTTWYIRPAERLALTGEAAAFTDPFYSPGSDFIALENDLITDLVLRDLAGCPEYAERGALYGEFMKLRFAATLALYRGQYSLLGSLEALQLKWEFDIACYYNLWLDAYMLDHHLDLAWLRDQRGQGSFILAAVENFGRLFARVDRSLTEAGQYYRANLGGFRPGLAACEGVTNVGTARTRKQVLRATAAIFNHTHRRALALLGDARAETAADRPIYDFFDPAVF